MKKLLCMLLLLLTASTALAEFDTDPLREDPNLYVFNETDTFHTVYRAVNQPYLGQVDEPIDGELVAFAEFITLSEENLTVPRLMVCTVVWDTPLRADHVALTVEGARYTFPVETATSEYDGQYMEDHTIVLVEDGLEMLKAMARRKKDTPIRVELLALGETVFAGEVIIPGADAADLYDRYVDLGGRTQNLKKVAERWPCQAEKVK